MNERKIILIADDEPIGRQLLEAILINENFELHFAKDGREAIEKVENLLPDLVLLDVMMPHIDGFGVCKFIKENDKLKNIPVFLITALDDRDSKLKGLELGANDYISKPFDKNEILSKIKNYFNTQNRKIDYAYHIKDFTDFLNEIPSIRNINDVYLKQLISKNSFIIANDFNNFLINLLKKDNRTLFYFTEFTEKSLKILYFDLMLESFFLKRDISKINDFLNNNTLDNLYNFFILLIHDNKKCEVLNVKYFIAQIKSNKVIIYEPMKDFTELFIDNGDIFLIGTYNITRFFNHINLKDNIINFINNTVETQYQIINKWIESYKKSNDEDVFFTKICI